MEDTRLKQRLVGAIMLVSLAVIFIPMILSGGDPAVNRLSGTNIPEKPERDFVSRIIPLDKQAPEPAPIKAKVAESAPKQEKKAESKVDSKPAKAKTAAKVKPKVVAKAEVKPTPKPVVKKAPAKTAKASKPSVKKGVSAWVIQVGSFGSKKNAYGLRDKLRGKGFNAFVDSIHQKEKTTYRVRIGPEVKKSKADTMLAKVQKITGSKGFVTRYP